MKRFYFMTNKVVEVNIKSAIIVIVVLLLYCLTFDLFKLNIDSYLI